jgi:GNAT superfamily N-acetyltransferase
MELTISLLADSLDSVEAVAELRWREWGHAPEPEDPAHWLHVTRNEAGREELPVTFVAHDRVEAVLGAVGLDAYDLDERRDTTPWVTGMIVRPEVRGHGVGRSLLSHLERWAAEHRIPDAWVGTETRSAAAFYERCGWIPQESFVSGSGDRIEVLHKYLQASPR